MCVCPTAVERKLHLGVPKEVWKDQNVYITNVTFLFYTKGRIKKEHE